MNRWAPLQRGLLLIRTSGCALALLAGLWFVPEARADEGLGLPTSAVGRAGKSAGKERIRARLLVDSSGESARVGVLFDLDPGWHLYWRNPGETGLPTELEWSVEPAAVGPIQWPAPARFDDPATELSSYGYEEQVLLASFISDFIPGQQVSVEAKLLICETLCIPANFSLHRQIEKDPDWIGQARERKLFARYAARVPIPPDRLGVQISALFSRSTLRPGDHFEGSLVIESCGTDDARCVPVIPADANAYYLDLPVDEVLDLEFSGIASDPEHPNVSYLNFRGVVDSDPEMVLSRLTGVVALRSPGNADEFVSIDIPFPGAEVGAISSELGHFWPVAVQPASSSDAPTSAANSIGLFQIILLAVLGGILLNAMPCVLPVLGIKVCSAAELAQRDSNELRRHGFAYLAGVLASMAALAVAVSLLQAAGTSVGWGFQFQEPLFVAAVAAVVVLFALNLFGVYEISISTSELSNLGSEAHGPARSFFDGLLAVVLATPCTAPFLGTAVGFAFAGGPGMIFAIFLAIGFGLAAPYCAICLVPGWARFVPKPGNWMMRLRTGLGFLLLATAVWLLWIFGRSAGNDGVIALLALLVALAFGAWLLGWVQSQSRPGAMVVAALAIGVLAVVGINAIEVPAPGSTQTRIGIEGPWKPFEVSSIRASLQANQPVFVSFTADWCITCKVNEHGVLADSRVRDALERGGFVSYRGDWTHRDEAIRSELARHGRAGVPLYLVYDPRRPESPRILPEILTVGTVLEALRDAAPAPRAGNQVRS